MPDVVGGWLCSLLGMSGGKLGWDMGISGLDTPIWDVLAPEGKREGALWSLQRVPEVRVYQLGKRCQLGLGSELLLGSLGLVFHGKNYVL
jgi:hypothetical protein